MRYKLIALIAALSVIYISIPCAEAVQAPLVNPGFEEGATGWVLNEDYAQIVSVRGSAA